jgi:hypothetical protein
MWRDCLKKLNKLEVRKWFHITITNRFATLENLNTSDNTNWAYGMWQIQETGSVLIGVWWEDLRERHLEDLDIGGKLILKRIKKGKEGIHLAQERGRWKVLVNVVINLWVP